MVRMGTKGRLLWGSWWWGRRVRSLGARWARKGGRERREGQIRMVVISASLFVCVFVSLLWRIFRSLGGGF